MEQSWEDWSLHMEMNQDDDFLEQCHTDIDDEFFLRDILQEPAFSSESETQCFHHPFQNNFTATTVAGAAAATDGSSLSSDNEIITGLDSAGKRPPHSSSPRRYILSFDDSTIIPATAEPSLAYEQLISGQGTRSSKSNSPLSSKKRTLENRNLQQKPEASQGGKKSRSDSRTLDHIIAERKRRQELTERFIALSATIPDLKKTDKTSVLREAINYVKQLQERVSELEKRNNNGGNESIIFLKKTEMCANEDATSGETSFQDCCRPGELLPDVEARLLGNEVLIEIHCDKENGIERQILDQLENLHLCVTGSSVLPFGNSTLGITIIAQIGDAYKMTVNDLVKNLRQALSNHITCNTDPF